MSGLNPPHLGTVLDYEDDDDTLKQALESCHSCPQLDWTIDNLDQQTCQPESLEAEMERLRVLQSYRILDTGRKPSFEKLTALASRIFNVPICLVSLVDLGRQWFASNRGLGDVRETPRKVAFCAHVILSKLDVFVVNDTLLDDRFRESALVTGDPKIRFYAGAPLVTPEGYKLGTFCIIDRIPRPEGLSLEEKQNLREIAAMAMDQIQETKLSEEESQDCQSRQIACVAHDLITPLTSIQLNMGLLSEDETFLNAMGSRNRDILRNTKECVDLMSGICQKSIRDFRGKSTQAANASDHHPQGTVNMRKLVESIQHIMETHPQKRVPLRFQVGEGVPAIIQGDALAIFRASLNYLSNACTVTESGSIEFRISVRGFVFEDSLLPADSREEKRVVFECFDGGPGIPDSHVKDLFTINGGLELNEENGSTGLGLGLYSVAETMTMCGGDYGYEPCLDEKDDIIGSKFWFSVPLEVGEDGVGAKVDVGVTPTEENGEVVTQGESETKPVHITQTETQELKIADGTDSSTVSESGNLHSSDETAPEGVEYRVTPAEDPEKQQTVGTELPIVDQEFETKFSVMSRKQCALVIDDSKTIRKVIKRALEKFGFVVTTANDGLQGLEEMKSTVFDFVLCDFLMPFMDGVDCVKSYREWESNNRNWFHQFIVGFSAHADSKDAERGLAVGMNKFVSKPVPIRILKELVESEDVMKASESLDALFDDSRYAPYFIQDTGKSQSDIVSLASSFSNSLQNFTPFCLVVEDTVSISKAFSRCVERCGWQCVLAKDGTEGLRLLKSRNWNAVFVDDQLPLQTGTALMQKFRLWESQNRVARQQNAFLCSTGIDSISSVPKGFDGMLVKPFNFAKVSETLKSSLVSTRKAKLV